MVKALPTAAVESSGGGVSTEPPRRSERMLRTRKRSRHASPSSPAPAPAPAPARRRQTGKQRSRTPSQWIYDQEIEGGSVDDAEAEISGATLFYLTEEEILQRHKRLYKKRANMGLALYNKNNPEDIYEFTSMLLTDVCNFMDGGVCYTHINFKARNVTTRSEELFFAELALNNSVVYANSRYSTTACSIVDDNCVGGKRDMLGVEADLPVERFDEKNCYACAEKMKHPTGMTYRGGHYRDDYFVGCESD